jgi:hypothetical protein
MLLMLEESAATWSTTATLKMLRARPQHFKRSFQPPTTPCRYGLHMLMAVGQGAGDRKALNDLSVIFRDGIGVSPDTEESVRWASVLGLMDNNASAAQSLRQLGYPRGFTGVVLPNGSSVASAITDDPPVQGVDPPVQGVLVAMMMVCECLRACVPD